MMKMKMNNIIMMNDDDINNNIEGEEKEEKYHNKKSTTKATSKRKRKKKYPSSSSKIIIILRFMFVVFIIDYMFVDNYLLLLLNNNDFILVSSIDNNNDIIDIPTTTTVSIKTKTVVNISNNTNTNTNTNTMNNDDNNVNKTTTTSIFKSSSSSISSSSTTASSSSSSGGGVVLMGIFCNSNQKKIRNDFRRRQSSRSRLLRRNNNNNNNSTLDVVVCSLGTYYLQKQSNCKLVYTFVIFGQGGGGGGNTPPAGIITNESNISEDGRVSFLDRTTTNANRARTAPSPPDDNDIVILDNPNNKKITTTQIWLKYVASIMNSYNNNNIDYVAKMDIQLQLSPRRQSQSTQQRQQQQQQQRRHRKQDNNTDIAGNTTTTNNKNNNNILSILDFDKYFTFVKEYLPPRPYNKRVIVSRFTNYWFCEWPSQVDKIPSNKNKPKPNNKGTIHFYATKQFWILSTDLVIEYYNNQTTHIKELSEYWKHRNLLAQKQPCKGLLEDYELSTYAFQYNENLPLNIIPISEQYKFWMLVSSIPSSSSSSIASTTTSVVTTTTTTTTTTNGVLPSNNNNSNNLAMKPSPLLLPTNINKSNGGQNQVVDNNNSGGSVVLMGIFCRFQDKPFRDMFRSLFKIHHPKVCSLGTYKEQQKQKQQMMTTYKKHGDDGGGSEGNEKVNDIRPSSVSSSCEFVYAFVIGANTTNSTTTPTERVTGSLEEIIISPTMMMIMMMNHSSNNNVMLMDEDEIKTMHDDDLIFLNIRENMNEGKSTTWLYVASQIAIIYCNNDIDYIGKMDTDTIIYFDRYFNFASDYLPPAPYNARKLISVFADKSWWGYNKPFMYMGREHSYMSEKEAYFKYHYPGSSSSDPTKSKFGIHIQAQGQMYILSQDLAMGVAEIAHLASSSSVPNNNNNYYRNHLETIEDHDVSTLAYLWLVENPLNHVLIKASNKFWDHGGPLKRSRKQTWEMVWNDEINRMKKISHTS